MFLNVLILCFLISFLYGRIKNTPIMVSEKKYNEKNKISIQKFLDDSNSPYMHMAIDFSFDAFFVYYIGLIVFYAILGTKIDNPFFACLTIIQIVLALFNIMFRIRKYIKDLKNKNFQLKFYRFENLFVVIVDYLFYIYGIYYILLDLMSYF